MNSNLGRRKSATFEVETKGWGTIGVIRPRCPDKESRYILLIPGFTGDALSHHSFIEEATSSGFGILAVTPKWDTSIRTNVNCIREALMYAGTVVRPEYVRIIRANSFGAYLATQILDINPNLTTAIFIAPCSATQLCNAGPIIGQSVKLDYSAPPAGVIGLGRIYMLNHDHIVPELDSFFRDAIRQYDVQYCDGDHFTAQDQSECCYAAINWLMDFKSNS